MNPKLDTSWALSKLCLLAMTLLLVPASVLALQYYETGIPVPGSQEMITAATVDAHNSVQFLSTGNFEIRRPIGRILERETWPDTDLPSAPTGIFLPAGDLNGDGRNDLMQTRLRLADLRTDNLSDLSDRTLIYYSGSFTGNHDQVIYDDILLPAGDLTGDGKANLLGKDILGNTTVYSHDGTALQAASATTQVTLPAELSVSSSKWGTDIDGDGYEDFAFTLSTSGYPDAEFELFILYGGNLDSELGVGVYDTRTILPAELDGMRLTAVTDVFELDGAIHIILSMQSSFSRRFAVILSIDETRTASFIQAIQLTDYNHFQAGRIFTATLSPDGDPYLVASDFGFRPDRSFYFPPSAEEGEIFSDVPIALHPFRVWPAGDLNNDGTTNFVANESATGPLRFGGFPNGIAEGFTLGDHFPGFGTDVRLLTGDLFEFGDLTGDGSDNLIYSFIGGANSAAGVIRVAGSEGGVLSSEEFFYDEESFPFRANTAYALGDFTGNGNDDFAVSFSQAFLGSGKLNFYEGGSNWQTPAASWTIPAGKVFLDIVSGRFTDPDRLDLVILFAETPDLSTPQLRTNVLEFYTEGILAGQTPDKVLRDVDVYPGLTRTFAAAFGAINTMANAGDVTNSGYDDLLIASANVTDQNLGPLPALLFAGGPSFMDGSPDAVFDFPAEDLGFGIGGALTGLGDINGNGIDDFAITNLNQGGSSDFAEFGSRRLGGRIHVYFGRDGDSNFGEPDITLRADRESITSGNDMWLFGMSTIATGDFLGTGRRGLSAKPFQHHKRADATVGVAGVHVFQRNLLDEDPQPDQLLPLHSSIMAINPSSEFLPFMGWALMSGIPDLTSNGRDELLIIGSAGHTNAVLHYGRDPLSPVPDVVFESPNSSITMGAPGTFINRQYRTAIGDFNGDGKLNFLAVQDDTNFPDSPVYLYELGRAGGVQVQVTKTEPVDSGGGTVEDEETNTKVVIPEDALDSEVEIEIGTFPVTPEGADVAGVMVYLGPSGTTFSEPVEVTVSYDPDNLPDGVAEEDLVLLRYDEATSEWEELLPSTVNTEEKTITGFTTRFSGFGAGVLKIPTRTDHIDHQVPGRIALHQNYPNPFNPVTNIRWELNAEQHVHLSVYDLLGRKVMDLVNGVYPAGVHTVAFDAGNLASGVYLYRLEAGSVMLHRKMTVVK